MTESSTVYTAGDLPRLRRMMADFVRDGAGRDLYEIAIRAGRQTICPAGTPKQAAAVLAGDELARLRDGDLYFVDADMCDLLDAAAPTMPLFAPMAADLPSRSGLVLLARPLDEVPQDNAAYIRDAVRGVGATGAAAERIAAEFRQTDDLLGNSDVQVVGASWGPFNPGRWPAGGVFMSFYARSRLWNRTDAVTDARTAASLERARATVPPLTVENEAAFPLRPVDDPDPDGRYVLPDSGTIGWARMILAVFQLAAQANLAESQTVRTARAERRQSSRAGLPERDVRLIGLRRAISDARHQEAGAGNGDERAFRHRWIVRGHWRNHWWPSVQAHRPRWIAPYLKGPDGAPLLGGDKVYVVRPPGARQGEHDAAVPSDEAG